MMIVSACLAGFNTRYDSTNCMDNRVAALVSAGKAIPLCPEQLGGLSTPRIPVELCRQHKNGSDEPDIHAVGADGKDYTDMLLKGAEETLRIACVFGVKRAVLKDGSPSCGVTYIWCSGGKMQGKGITAELLEKNDIEVITVDSL
ncbi:MAG: DUF523 domain-containing protein [Nitrospirota bacterium]